MENEEPPDGMTPERWERYDDLWKTAEENFLDTSRFYPGDWLDGEDYLEFHFLQALSNDDEELIAEARKDLDEYRAGCATFTDFPYTEIHIPP